ncbi:phage tail protein [Paraburkholderia strydomiana]|uniref:Phage tail protein n=1 Tax=Paraburkholderia strydomiana TaxID=1245417 RepID=A0ABW9BTX8_9BURK
MRRISTATRVVDKFGTGKDGFTNGDAVAGLPSTDLEDVWFDHVQEEIANVVEGAGLTLDPANRSQLLAAIQAMFAPVIGSVRNLRMTVAPGASTGALTADEITVGTALGGKKFLLPNFNKTINLAATGPGGMDTGTATANGFLGLYAMYNPSAALSATNPCLVGHMEGASALTTTYTYANAPAGYIASSLVAVVPISAVAGQFAAFNMMDRKVQIVAATVYSNSSASSIPLTSITTTAVPYSAKRFQGSLSLTNSASGSAIFSFYGDANGCGVIQFSLNTQTAGGNLFGLSNIEMATPRTVRFSTSINGGSPSFQTILYISGYEF